MFDWFREYEHALSNLTKFLALIFALRVISIFVGYDDIHIPILDNIIDWVVEVLKRVGRMFGVLEIPF